MNNLKKKLSRKLRVEKFFKEQLWQFLIVTAFISLYAWLFDKWIVSIMFCISHIVIRLHFEKQYHCGTTFICLFTTLTIAFFGISTNSAPCVPTVHHLPVWGLTTISSIIFVYVATIHRIIFAHAFTWDETISLCKC